MDITQEGRGPQVSATVPVLMWIAVLVLAVAVVVLAVLQVRGAAHVAWTRQALETLQGEVGEAQERLGQSGSAVSDLASRVNERLLQVEEGLGGLGTSRDTLRNDLEKAAKALTALEAAVARIPTSLPATQLPPPAPPALAPQQPPALPAPTPAQAASQEEVRKEIAALKARIEALRTEEVLREAKALQTQIGAVQGRVDKAEREVVAIERKLDREDLPALRQNVAKVTDEVDTVEQEVRGLSRETEAYKKEVSDFFRGVFYNDPWARRNSASQP
ncbi:MAG: hypothetical protein JXR77_04685 [Lentisphaeria bacterium]|nr:hypothetical protein [Lentisphaeria bacterium]